MKRGLCLWEPRETAGDGCDGSPAGDTAPGAQGSDLPPGQGMGNSLTRNSRALTVIAHVEDAESPPGI